MKYGWSAIVNTEVAIRSSKGTESSHADAMQAVQKFVEEIVPEPLQVRIYIRKLVEDE